MSAVAVCLGEWPATVADGDSIARSEDLLVMQSRSGAFAVLKIRFIVSDPALLAFLCSQF